MTKVNLFKGANTRPRAHLTYIGSSQVNELASQLYFLASEQSTLKLFITSDFFFIEGKTEIQC